MRPINPSYARRRCARGVPPDGGRGRSVSAPGFLRAVSSGTDLDADGDRLTRARCPATAHRPGRPVRKIVGLDPGDEGRVGIRDLGGAVERRDILGDVVIETHVEGVAG